MRSPQPAQRSPSVAAALRLKLNCGWPWLAVLCVAVKLNNKMKDGMSWVGRQLDLGWRKLNERKAKGKGVEESPSLGCNQNFALDAQQTNDINLSS